MEPGASGRESEMPWESYRPRLFRYTVSLTRSREAAEDLTQETMLRALRQFSGGFQPDNPSAWLFRIATNLCLDYHRRRRLIQWVPFLRDHDPQASQDFAEAFAEHHLVWEALRRLTPETRALVLLKDLEGFSTREIAEMTGQGYEAVKKRLVRAHESLRTEYLRLQGGTGR